MRKLKELERSLKLSKKRKYTFFRALILNSAQKFYFYTKQYAFAGVNLVNPINVQSIVSTSLSISATGATAVTISSTLAISFVGSLFLSLVESHVPTGFVKTGVSLAKVVVTFPVTVSEYVTNSIIGLLEKDVVKTALPINITAVWGLMHSPKISDLGDFKRKFGKFLYKFIR